MAPTTPDGPAPAPDGTPALSVEELSKRFGSGGDAVRAVDDVSFSVERGSVVGLLGPNGAGKTTLIKSVLGTVIPDEGTVRVLGRDAADGRRATYANVDAMLEGARNDYWRLTVRENLRYFATVGGVAPDSVADRHDRLLDRLDLAEKADTPVRELSRGMKQKMSLASVLAGGAKLVFLDEPTLGLDVEGSRTLRRELRRLAEEDDLTVVVSSHDMRVIEDVCDRVIVMSAGAVVADDSVERLLGAVDDYRVRVASEELSPATIDDLRGRFDVVDADAGADPPTVEVRTDGDAAYDLFDALRAADVTLDRVDTVEPSLEDVFVRLTGAGAGGTSGSEPGDEDGAPGTGRRRATVVGDDGGAR
ncbi:ABC transporter ATP-binding protein [Halobaculum gomorrense]|uniref:ABC-2 type transport system ATP-binding protein n=1 Tax=Halobaculum gomorrense TaxID=43928 RepID=A0A1M5JLL0_9EURY|nr:ABC transporter ATP-binding protein [Halobaculum gomorrense]SHG41457.1 ABC-2 type transport system ATP-binding protein [Halobaculum gomorrense]